MFNWAFRTAEHAVHFAVNKSVPLVQRLDRPIQLVDQTLVKGIDKLEVTAPIIKEQPQEIYNQARTKIIQTVQPHISKVCNLKAAGQQKAASLKDLSWNKANEVLATQYGSMAVTGVDTTAALAEKLLDYYFPKTEEDSETDDNGKLESFNCIPVFPNFSLFPSVPISAQADPVLHTVQTVGRLSNRIARRVYRTVSNQVKSFKKEDVQEYVAMLIAVLRLTQYLNFINEKAQSATAAITGTPETEKPAAKQASPTSNISPAATSAPTKSTSRPSSKSTSPQQSALTTRVEDGIKTRDETD